MLDPLRFLIRHGNIVAALLVSVLALFGAEQEGGLLPLVSASLIVAAALSVQAAERMAVLEHRCDWRGATRRQAELRDRFLSLQATLSEI